MSIRKREGLKRWREDRTEKLTSLKPHVFYTIWPLNNNNNNNNTSTPD